VCEHHLTVGLYDDLDAPGSISLGDVMVAADLDGFHLYDAASGREISPFVPHLLVPEFAPNVARFLREAPALGRPQLSGWNWKPLQRSAFLPGVRYGRAVLHLATWRLTAQDLHGAVPEDALADWCRRWNVPDLVRLVDGDQYLVLDLRTAQHRRMVCEAATKKTVLLQEDPSPDTASNWLQGPGGGYTAEIVVPVYRTGPSPRGRIMPAARPRTRQDAMRHVPGGSWTSQYLYCSADAQQEVLDRLGPFVHSLGDAVQKWFFIRYSEQHTRRPHLRLRFHGDPETLNGHVLDRLHAWSGELMAAGLVSDAALHTYRAEAERYGGPSLIGQAEEFFCADSRLTLHRLARGSGALLDVAVDVIALVRRFLEVIPRSAPLSRPADEARDWEMWFLDRFPKNEGLHRAFNAVRREALDRMSLEEPPGSVTDVEREWIATLEEYALAIHRAAAEPDRGPDPSAVLEALVHMHCNRRLKHAEDERRVYALARGAAEALVSRRRAAYRGAGRLR
jgi:mRNA interferase HicA